MVDNKDNDNEDFTVLGPVEDEIIYGPAGDDDDAEQYRASQQDIYGPCDEGGDLVRGSDERRRDLLAFLVWLTDGNGMVLMEGGGHKYHEVAGDEDLDRLLDQYEGWEADQAVAAMEARYEQ